MITSLIEKRHHGLLAQNHSGVLIKIGELVVTACLVTWSITHRQFNWDGKASQLNQKW